MVILGGQRSALATPVFRVGVVDGDVTTDPTFGLNVIGTVEFDGFSDPTLPGDPILINLLTLTGTLFGSPISFAEDDILASAHGASADGRDLIWFTIPAPVRPTTGCSHSCPPTHRLCLRSSASMSSRSGHSIPRERTESGRGVPGCVSHLTQVACPCLNRQLSCWHWSGYWPWSADGVRRRPADPDQLECRTRPSVSNG
jgi:hypothetical protein